MPQSPNEGLRKTSQYKDRPNSFNGNVREVIGIIIYFLFAGAFLYLVITGLPTIRIALGIFLDTVGKLL